MHLLLLSSKFDKLTSDSYKLFTSFSLYCVLVKTWIHHHFLVHYLQKGLFLDRVNKDLGKFRHVFFTKINENYFQTCSKQFFEEYIKAEHHRVSIPHGLLSFCFNYQITYYSCYYCCNDFAIICCCCFGFRSCGIFLPLIIREQFLADPFNRNQGSNYIEPQD